MLTRKILQRALISSAFVLSTAFASSAAVLVDKGFDPDNQVSSSWITNGGMDDFFLASDASLTKVTFWGSYWFSGNVPSVESFEASIFERSGNALGNLVSSSALSFSKEDTGKSHNNFEPATIYKFSGFLGAPLALTGGEYWLRIKNLAVDGDTFTWERSAYSAPIGMFNAPDGLSAPNASGDFAFVLESSPTVVPLPASFFLLLTALAGLVASRWSIERQAL